MKKQYIFGRLVVFFGLAFALLLNLSGGTAAIAEEKPDQRIQLSPTYTDLDDVQPGESFEGKFEVKNTGAKELKYQVEVSPYSVEDGDYTVNSEQQTTYTQISDWIEISKKSGTLAPDAADEIEYKIDIPSNAPGGGQYALITVKMVNDADGGDSASFKTINQLGFRVLANIDGEISRQGVISENKIPRFLFSPPITATSTVENKGNTHIKAKYILQVFPLFGGEEVYTNEETAKDVTIFPETSRFNTANWDGAPQLGIFRVKQTVTLTDENNTTSSVENIVFLCPIWFLFIILLIIFVVIFWIVSRVRAKNKS